MPDKPFWETKTLQQMSKQEWESLCDGCAKCCLIKLEDDETEEVYYTKVACKLLDHDTCQCTHYQQRHIEVPTCLWLTPEHLDTLKWLPNTCAYRLIYEGKALPEWHHLVSGDKNSVHLAGVSVKGRALSEEYVHPDGYEEHIVHWVE